MQLVSVDVRAVPTLHSENVVSLLSDSLGFTTHRIQAGVWDIYSKETDSYEHCPEGILVEQFDSLLNVAGSIVADTAYKYVKKNLWHAIGNVLIKNSEGRTFETSELFWNEKAQPNAMNAFYTDKPVKVVEPDGTFTFGVGLRANQSLDNIVSYKTGGEFFFEDSPKPPPQAIFRSDSIQ